MKREIIGIFVCILFFGASVALGVDIKTDYNTPYSEWSCKTSVTLESIIPVDDYQVKIELDPSFFDYSKSNLDGSDIRFVDSIGNKLSYWIEDWNPEGISIIWVKILYAGTSTIDIYYGNPEAESESNGDETFVFFDDFSGTELDENKWIMDYVTVSVSDGEAAITELTGEYGHLISKKSIPKGTVTKFRYKQKKDGPNQPTNQYVGLQNFSVSGNYISACYSIMWYEWSFGTGCNGEGTKSNVTGGCAAKDYHIDEYRWYNNTAEYYYNYGLKVEHNTNVPYIDLSVVITAYEFNTMICDWVYVVKYYEESGDVVFYDDFNDNEKDLSKWTEFGDVFWEEINQRTEFQVYEQKSGGIESSFFNVYLSATDSVIITWDLISDIGCESTIGAAHVDIYDDTGDNWIKMWYARGSNMLKYIDSKNHREYTIKSKQYDDSWDNEIQIFKDKYHVRLNDGCSVTLNDPGWVYSEIFPGDATLKLKVYLDASGATPSAYMYTAFDNVKVRIPVFGEERPILPFISGKPRTVINTPTIYTISALDPDLDDITFYIEWEEDKVGEFLGPYPCDSEAEIEITWSEYGDYKISLKAIDSTGRESIWREITVKVRLTGDRQISCSLLLKILENHPYFFSKLRNLLGLYG